MTAAFLALSRLDQLALVAAAVILVVGAVAGVRLLLAYRREQRQGHLLHHYRRDGHELYVDDAAAERRARIRRMNGRPPSRGSL